MRRVLVVSLLVGAIVLPMSGNAQSASRGRAAPLSSDFNGDGFGDLAISASWEEVDEEYAAGAVNVIYGSAAGLSAAGNQFWSENSPGIPEQAKAGDNFGYSLATADFNGDGFADLAVGTPYKNVGNRFLAGAFWVIYGSATGLTSTGSTFTPGREFDEELGYSLAAGDFDGDGFADLAAGGPDKRVNGHSYAGVVRVFAGSASGLSGTGVDWTQDTPGLVDQAEEGDAFGNALAAGDFNQDGFGDLAAGAYDEGVGEVDEAGAVIVIYGSPSGLTTSGNQLWSQDSAGIRDASEDDDEFAFALATGDFNGDGADELAVGSFNETIGQATFAGAVNILYGGSGGLSAAGNQFWSQNSPGVLGQSDVVDRFGAAIATGDFDGDGFSDLAAGVEGEAVDRVSKAGAVNVLYGSASGLTAARNQLWNQNSPGVLNSAQEGDSLGGAVAAGNWGSGEQSDLAAGAIYESFDGASYGGGVNVLYGTSTGLTATGNQFWTQNSPGIKDRAESSEFFGYAMA